MGIYYLRDLFTAAMATGPHSPVKWPGSGEVFTRDEIVMGYHIRLLPFYSIPKRTYVHNIQVL
jgi:hypothetical protein